MDVIEKLSEIFSIFHDGGIDGWEGDSKKLLLTIGCTYLAERIRPDFVFFYLEIKDIENLQMECWTPPGSAGLTLTSYSDIFSADLEISSSDVKEEQVFVYFHQHDSDLGYSGGMLSIRASGVKIFQHDMTEISLESLALICRDYWDSVRNRNS